MGGPKKALPKLMESDHTKGLRIQLEHSIARDQRRAKVMHLIEGLSEDDQYVLEIMLKDMRRERNDREEGGE